MKNNKKILSGLSLLFLSLISFSVIFSVYPKEESCFNLEEKADKSESKNEMEEELKETKLIFGTDFTLKKANREKLIFAEYNSVVKSIFLSEIQTPPPEFQLFIQS